MPRGADSAEDIIRLAAVDLVDATDHRARRHACGFEAVRIHHGVGVERYDPRFGHAFVERAQMPQRMHTGKLLLGRFSGVGLHGLLQQATQRQAGADGL